MPQLERPVEREQVASRVADWARGEASIVAVMIVGSVARGDARSDSDLDIVVLTDDYAAYLTGDAWVREAVGESAPIVRSKRWGGVFERRVRLSSDLEVEFNFAASDWASTSPLNEGTALVVADGCRTIFDPNGLIGQLEVAVAGTADRS